MIVDMYGKIVVWFLPGLLLPHQVVSRYFLHQPYLGQKFVLQEQFNKTLATLKPALNSSLKQPASWQEKGFISTSPNFLFGCGRIGISVG